MATTQLDAGREGPRGARASQQKRALEHAQSGSVPGVSDEDPPHLHDFPDVYGDAGFQIRGGPAR